MHIEKCWPQWSRPARQALISKWGCEIKMHDSPTRGLWISRGSSSQATNPWAGATAHRSLKPKKTRAWDPERDFCQDDPGNETSDQAPKEQALLFSKLYKLQANWRPQDTPWSEALLCLTVGTSSSERRAECWCLLSFQQPCYLPKSNCPRKIEPWPLPVKFHSRYTLSCTFPAGPWVTEASNCVFGIAGSLCMYGKDSEGKVVSSWTEKGSERPLRIQGVPT